VPSKNNNGQNTTSQEQQHSTSITRKGLSYLGCACLLVSSLNGKHPLTTVQITAKIKTKYGSLSTTAQHRQHCQTNNQTNKQTTKQPTTTPHYQVFELEVASPLPNGRLDDGGDQLHSVHVSERPLLVAPVRNVVGVRALLMVLLLLFLFDDVVVVVVVVILVLVLILVLILVFCSGGRRR
jgi:hypothetical protein